MGASVLAKRLLLFWLAAAATLLTLATGTFLYLREVQTQHYTEHLLGDAVQVLDSELGSEGDRLTAAGKAFIQQRGVDANLALFYNYYEANAGKPEIFDYPARELATALHEAARAVDADWAVVSGKPGAIAGHYDRTTFFWSHRDGETKAIAVDREGNGVEPDARKLAGLGFHADELHLETCANGSGIAIEWEGEIVRAGTGSIGRASIGRCLSAETLNDLEERTHFAIVIDSGNRVQSKSAPTGPVPVADAYAGPAPGQRWLGPARFTEIDGRRAAVMSVALVDGQSVGIVIVERDAAAEGGAGPTLIGTAIASLLAVTLLVMTAGLVYLRRNLTQPIERLREGAEQLRQGHYEPITGITAANELGDLASAFNEMTAGIQAREREIERERALLRTLVNTIPDLIWLKDQHGVYLGCNSRFESLYGATEAEIVGKTDYDFVSGEMAEFFREHDRKAMIKGAPSKNEEELEFADGHRELVETTKTPMRNERGELVGVLGIGHDITERKKDEARLQLAASVFENAREGIMITSPTGEIVDVNDSFTRITGYGRDEVRGRNARILQSGRQDRQFYQAMWLSLVNEGHWDGELWNRRKNGELYAEYLTIGCVRDDGGAIKHYVALLSDITAIKDHERQLHHVAHYDALTNLPNRVLLADRLRQAMAQSGRRRQKFAVIYLDLDGFKVVNDTYGHQIGDRLLMRLAAQMKAALREGDTLARLGGDEFVAVLLDLDDVQSSLPMIGRLLAAANQPMVEEGITLQVSASLGVTFFPQTEDVDADHLLRQADQAMYQAKLAGKNCYRIFDTEHDRALRGYHESLDRIRQGLMRQEFLMYYQPKVNMRTGAVVGAEALIRWQHPERGLLPPATFLAVIEEHQLSVELGYWVLDTVLKQIETWKRTGFTIPVSVNVGALQLQQTDFVERLQQLLNQHTGVHPGELELEVLETSALQDVAQVSKVMRACSDIGVAFALDDFGTGYSSLTYLKRLPATQLKIDQSFVRDMLIDPEDLAILEGVLGLARAFGRQAIAEGVETLEHGRLLLRLGCELGQGYAIARPMPAGDVPRWAAQWRPEEAWLLQRPVKADELPLIFAAVEHRNWVAQVESHLRGEREAPTGDHQSCRFGTWLYGKGRERYGDSLAFKAIDTHHRRAHERADELIKLKAGGQAAAVVARIGELHLLRDMLLADLEILAEDA